MTYNQGKKGGFDPHARIPDMDADGIDAAFLSEHRGHSATRGHPAEVHTGPSMMKMRSSSTFTFGNRACKSRARLQCVVVRRPSSRPASARIKALVQVAATLRHRSGAWRKNSIRPGVDGSVPRQKNSVSKTVGERLCHDADADRTAHEAAGLGQQMQDRRPARLSPCSRIRRRGAQRSSSHESQG